jgi:NADPH:quinone reductase-like Zn-dependent oxidoreductase
MARPLKAMMIAPFVSQEIRMKMTDPKQSDLTFLADLMQSGKLKPVIDRTYKFSELPEAIRYVEQGHARGKVVVAIE